MAILVHDDLYVLVNSTKFTHITSCQLSLNQETIDITSMDSSGWRELNVADKSWSLSIEAFYDDSGAENHQDVYDDLTGGSSHTLLLSTGVTGSVTYGGSGFPTSLEVDSSKGSGVTVSVSYEGTGTLTKSTV